MTTTTMPTSRALNGDPGDRHERRRLARRHEPDARTTSAATIDSSAARRASIGRSPVAVGVVARRRLGRRSVERVGDDVEVAGRHVRPAGLEGRQDDARRR